MAVITAASCGSAEEMVLPGWWVMLMLILMRMLLLVGVVLARANMAVDLVDGGGRRREARRDGRGTKPLVLVESGTGRATDVFGLVL